MKLRSIALASACMIFVALAACSKDGAKPSGKELHAEKLSTTVQGIGKACSSDFDCPSNGTTGCDWKCAGNGSTKSCMLLTPGAGVGSTGCYGDVVGSETRYYFDSAVAKRGVLCDVESGARCDKATRACVKTTDVGGKCSDPVECGKSGDCSGGKCVARAVIGASCKDLHCAAGAKCDRSSETCVALGAKGAKCSTNDDCASAACDGKSCIDAQASTEVCSL